MLLLLLLLFVCVVVASAYVFAVYTHTGRVVKVYDGDTITVASRVKGMGKTIYKFSVRFVVLCV